MDTCTSCYATDIDQLGIIRQLVEHGYATIDNLLSNPDDLQCLLQEASAAAAQTTTSSTQGLGQGQGQDQHKQHTQQKKIEGREEQKDEKEDGEMLVTTATIKHKCILVKTDQPDDIRSDLTHDVDPLDTEQLPYIAKASRTLQFVVGGAVDNFLSQPLYCRERPQFACYAGAGGFYTRHYDNPRLLKGGTDNLRRLTILLYLNQDWDETQLGGQLRLHVKTNDALDVTIAPKANRCVLFFADLIEHEVLPSYGNRLALTIWLSELNPDPASGLTKEINSNDQLMRDFFVSCCNRARQ